MTPDMVSELLRQLMKAGWPDGVLVNINFPGCPAAEVDGWALVPQGRVIGIHTASGW